MDKINFKHLNARLVGILRTKPGTSKEFAIQAIQTAFDAGAEAVEITSNSGYWQQIVGECVRRNLNIGVGSIKNKETAKEAISLSAKFLVSPGFFEDAIEVANKNRVPILPGVFTEPNFKQAIDLKIADTKFFPANVKTNEELFKAIREPFRDEFDELIKDGWSIKFFDPNIELKETVVIKSPTQFYKLYLDKKNKKPDSQIVIKLPDGKSGFERLKDFASESMVYGIRTYAVGGINDKNMEEVLTKYCAYGVCPGSGMFNGEAILNGDFNRVKSDVEKHVRVINEISCRLSV